MAMSCYDMAITKAHQIQLFLTSLAKSLHTDVMLQRPMRLGDVVMLAHAFEQQDVPPQPPLSARPQPRSFTRQQIKHHWPQPAHPRWHPQLQWPTRHQQSSASLRIRLWRITRGKKCFHCDKSFMRAHKLYYKQLFTIEVMAEEDNIEVTSADGELTISIHTPVDIQPRSGQMVQLLVNINSTHLITLLNSSPTNNFVDMEAVADATIKLGGCARLRVVVSVRIIGPSPYRIHNNS
jgi:hypothetical protein